MDIEISLSDIKQELDEAMREPISTEYLKSVGFKAYEGSNGTYYKMIIHIEPHILGYSERELMASPDAEMYYLSKNFLMRLRYVDQLQVLYFALTGEQLRKQIS